ncbi:MAG: hypothetical protein IH593_14115, partial [Bacteroidales bacterium]|nr:hypothetical protein [Bacteroidales bacterium]
MNRHILLAVSLAVIAVSCGRNSEKATVSKVTPAVTVIDKGFSKYIAAYTTGVIPAGSVIQVVFTPEFAAAIDRGKSQNLFTFTPSLKGKTEWADDLTLIFRPSKPLAGGTEYGATLNLGRLGDVEERLRFFPMNFRTIEKNFTVTVNPLKADPPAGETYTLTGTLVTSDIVEADEAEDYLSARTGKRTAKISWDHDGGNIHSFTVEKIARTKEESTMTVEWNGSKYGVRAKGEIPMVIPAAGVFSVTDVKVNTGDSKSLEIIFSDIIDSESELEGLITMTPSHPLTVTAEGNKITVIPGDFIVGEITLNIDGALRNSTGEKLGKSVIRQINFTPLAPGLKRVGKGVIMPSSGNLIFPFMAANLSAVD